jgi:ribosomal-protein-alanine N-acetyltransferase
VTAALAPDHVEMPAAFAARAAVGSDLEAIHHVEELGQQAPWSLGVLARELEVDWSTIWVVEKGDQIVAYLCFWTVADEIHILNVVVAPEARRQGIAAALVRGLIGAASGAEFSLITLEVRVGNSAARALYSAHGFAEIGRRAGYYSDNGEDAIVMARILEEE